MRYIHETHPANKYSARFFAVTAKGIVGCYGKLAASIWANDPAPGQWRGIWRIKEMR